MPFIEESVEEAHQGSAQESEVPSADKMRDLFAELDQREKEGAAVL